MKVFVVVGVLGFPIALVFSWAVEITSEKIERESEVEPNEQSRAALPSFGHSLTYCGGSIVTGPV